MAKVFVGRPINGISINGDEFLLDNDGEYLLFDSIEDAKALLLEEDEWIEDFYNFYDAETKELI